MKTTIGSDRARSVLPIKLARMLAPVLVPALAMTMPLGTLPVAHAQAQSAPETTEVRLRRIEAELRAVQRKVFPDGAGKTFGPEITAPASAAPSGAPATTAVTDLLTRMDSVEAQLQRLTAASEENQNHLSKLDARMAALEAASGIPAAASGPSAPQPGSTASAAVPTPLAETPKPDSKPDAKPVAKPAAKPEAGRSEPPPDRVAAVMAIEKPVSDDKGEDEYLYGYRLWEAKFFPEAQQQLLRVVQQFPRHARISYARNLLGRAYLDDGKPGTAAQYFLQNYQADRKGDRAADSLLYLGVAMSRLKEEKRACVAFGEFRQTYPDEVSGRLKGQFEAATKPVTCN